MYIFSMLKSIKSKSKKSFRLIVSGEYSDFYLALKKNLLNFCNMGRKVSRPCQGCLEEVEPKPLTHEESLVTVVIPCFNYGKYVLEAIDSALRQTIENVNIVVIDGGSTDCCTVNILESISNPRVKVMFRDGRHLVGDNRNYGIGFSQSRYICCLDADDTIDVTYLEKAIFHLETYCFDVVSTAINLVGAKNGLVGILEYPSLFDMVNANHVLTCAVFRKSLWESVGGYVDVGIGKDHVAEDWDFWVKLAANGARIRNICREALFNYRIHDGGSLSTSDNVKPIGDQKKSILKSNKNLLTTLAFKNSEAQQAKLFRCEPTQTALVSSFKKDPQKLNVLLAVPYFLIGGAERLLSGLCEHLARNGWRIVVISTLDQDINHGSSIEWFKSSTAEVYSLPRFLEEAEKADFVDYLIASRGIQCVLNAGSRLMYELMPRLKNVNPSICIIDFLFNKVGHVKSHLEFKRYITYALAENPEVFEWFVKSAGWVPELVAAVSSGVDLKRHSPRSRPVYLVDKYKIKDSELVVGFSGRISEEKAPEVYLEVAELCREHPNIRFFMTGGGPLAHLVSKRIEKIRPNTRIEFAGIVDDVDEYLALYDVLVLPSHVDGRPLVVMEALSCGVPVVASAVGGLPDLVTNKVNGYLVPPADAKAIASRIIQLAGDKVLLAELKENARRIAEERLDANEAHKNFKSVIETAIVASQSQVV